MGKEMLCICSNAIVPCKASAEIVEIAPAVALPEDIRAQMHADAVKLVSAAGYTSATDEFLVSPERGTYFTIECNPRIQVEHTITEQVLGVDLVEAQLRIAGGATLADLGLAARRRWRAARFRSAARWWSSAGTITATREPGGRGVRIDGHGYAGIRRLQYDPLLARLSCNRVRWVRWRLRWRARSTGRVPYSGR